MTLRLVLLVVGSGVALGAAPVLAQGRPLTLPKPPTHAQTGTAAAAAASPPAPEPRPGYAPRYERSRAGGAYRAPIRLPSQMGVDGRVYTNFGQGLVPVTRQCSSWETGVQQPTAPAFSQPQITQPVPQPIHQPVPGAAQQPNSVIASAPAACWTRAANGAFEVYRSR